MDYGVITIDTSIFEQESLKLESGLLGQLTQFKEGSAEFVMPDVIHQELTRHLNLKTCEASESLSSIPKKIEELRLLEEGQRVEVNKILDKILDKICPEDIVDARLKAFKENTGLKILRCGEFVEVDEILLKYHETRPPFAGKKNENAEKKSKNAEKKSRKAEKKSRKAEFPDAFALLCLENWANKYDKKILAISKDRGWQEFGESSSRIDVIEDLGEALEKFQPDVMEGSEALEKFQLDDMEGLSEAIEKFQLDAMGGLSEAIEKFQQGTFKAMKDANTFLEQLYDGKRPAEMGDIKDTLINEMPNLTPFVKFDSTFEWDSDAAYLKFGDFKFCPDKFDKESTHLVRVDRNEIVILMRIDVSVGVLANFQLRGNESIEDYAEKEDEIQLKVLLTLNREEDTVKLIKTELTSDNSYPVIDFGFIALGWDGSRY